MSAKDEAKSRKPYSVYLTPKAAWILEDFNRNSDFGSVSRTVEEMILAYNDVHEIIMALNDPRHLLPNSPTADSALSALAAMPIVISLRQAINRLKKGPTTEEEGLRKQRNFTKD